LTTDLHCTNTLLADLIKTETVVSDVQCARETITDDLCARRIRTNSLCTDDLQMNNLCANNVQVQDNFCATRADIDEIWTSTLNTNHVCVDGNVEHCTNFKAYLSLTTSVEYVLGTTINFNIIVDDPNGDVLVGPTRYVAPRTGYYIATLGVGVLDLTTTVVIAGVPVARSEIRVNDDRILKGFSPWLAFNSEFQNSVISGIVRLEAGDEVTASYRIFYLDPNSGVAILPGTVGLEAVGEQGQTFTETFLAIHYLSSDCPVECPPSPVQCPPCTTISCPPCQTVCNPVIPPCPPCDVSCDCDCWDFNW
jgi:hypothetical protein